jgi:prepilin peptidase CpaA
MQIDAFQATLFALFCVPIGIFTFYVDMKHKRISNLTVWALFITFVVIGSATLPLTDFLWRFAGYGIAFAYGFLMWMARQMGGGDVKFMAVAALFVHPGDAGLAIFILLAALVGSTLAVLISYHSPLRNLAPDWASWQGKDPSKPDSVGKGQKFTIPMGTGLGLALSSYLVMGAAFGQ